MNPNPQGQVVSDSIGERIYSGVGGQARGLSCTLHHSNPRHTTH